MFNLIFNPLEQFSFYPHYNCNTSTFLNAVTLHFFLIILLIKIFSYNIIKNNFLVILMNKVFKLFKTSYFKNTKLKIQIYIPLLFFLFLAILVNNCLGLIPYSYAITSSLVFNFYLVLTFFLGINLIGIIYHKWNFLNIFVPKGIPAAGLPALICFETISYFARIVSLTVRLFANILSGHILQHILISFSYKLFLIPNWYFLIFLIPWVITFIITYLEIVIAFLQAYVFITLLLIYFSNVIYLH